MKTWNTRIVAQEMAYQEEVPSVMLVSKAVQTCNKQQLQKLLSFYNDYVGIPVGILGVIPVGIPVRIPVGILGGISVRIPVGVSVRIPVGIPP